ncbi:MAG TPA: metallophosphoesterase [Acetobacteraceae bacterium]|jgi:serine/threonine protein phosphatase 1|nr:metallophosphoesterase [Acetobacteraceae bacterium]
MRSRPLRHARLRGVVAATTVPTWSAPRAEELTFTRSPGLLRPGVRIYAIGDIHGCVEPLRNLHAAIATDLVSRPIDHAMLIHLGDYIDEGPDPAGVLALLAAGNPIAGITTINLMGDHERTALDALGGDAPSATDWLHAGGETTLRSWHIDPASPRTTWRAAIPATHLTFLRTLTISHREDDYLFVHAGLRPGIPLRRQDRDDLLRIRQPFLYSEQEFPAVVVHGHTPAPAPVLRQNRIGIDTGSGTGGRLTCAVLQADQIGFIQI